MLHEQMLCGRELHVSTESMALKRQCQPPNKQLNLKFPVLYRRRLADEHVERESKGRIDAYKGTFRHANFLSRQRRTSAYCEGWTRCSIV